MLQTATGFRSIQYYVKINLETQNVLETGYFKSHNENETKTVRKLTENFLISVKGLTVTIHSQLTFSQDKAKPG